MDRITQNGIHNELAKLRKEISGIKSQIHSFEDRLDTFSDSLEQQAIPVDKEITFEQEQQASEYIEAGKIPVIEEKKEPFFDLKKISFEEDIGKKWFSRIGIISIFIGMVFFIKYLYDRHLMTPTQKLIIGIIVGLILILAGIFSNMKKFEKKYEYLSRILTGGGFAVLYLVIYAGHILYKLIPQELDLILLGLIVVFAVFLSLRLDSMVIASEAFFLGYVISFIGTISEYTLAYTTVLTIGLMIIVQRKGWINMGIGGLIAIYAIHFSWFLNHNSSRDFLTNSLFLSVYFIIFTVLAYTIRKQAPDETASLENFQSLFYKIPESYHSILIVALNSILSYGFFYSVINSNYERYAGLFTIIVACVYLALAYAALNKNAKELFAIYLTLCTTFITLAVPVQLNYEWVTFAWAIEGFILVMMGFHYNARGLRVFGNIVGLFTIIKTIFIDTGLKAFEINNILESTRFFSFFISIIALYASSMIYYKHKDKLEYEVNFWEYYLTGGVLLTTWILMLELKDEWITIAWAIEGFILLIIGFRHNARIRLLANAVGIITIVKTLLIDTGLESFDINNVLSSTRFFAFMIPIITFYLSSAMYIKHRDKPEYEREFWEHYLTAGVLLTTLILMLELKGGLISAAWSIQAIAILIAGFKYELSFVRKVGIGLFLLTILKVFIFDLAGLETLYRILSFMVLGAILLFASFVYSKYKDKL